MVRSARRSVAGLVALVALLTASPAAGGVPVLSRGSSGGHNGNGIVTGPDGAMWMTDPSSGEPSPSLVRVPVHPGRIRAFRAGDSSEGVLGGLLVARDGNFWYSDLRNLAVETPVLIRTTLAGKRTAFPVARFGDQPSFGGLTSAPDGELWFTGSGARFGLLRSVVERMALSGHATVVTARKSGVLDASIFTGPDRHLWLGSGLRITGRGTLQHVPETDVEMVQGAAGNLWGAYNGLVERLNRFGRLAKFIYPEAAAGDATTAIAAGPDGNMWFVNSLDIRGFPANSVLGKVKPRRAHHGLSPACRNRPAGNHRGTRRTDVDSDRTRFLHPAGGSAKARRWLAGRCQAAHQ